MGRPASTHGLLNRLAAMAAAGAGVIHFAVIDDHGGGTLFVAAFGAMGAAQWVSAVGLWRGATSGRAFAVWVHAAIVMTWLTSRTTGIPLVTGVASPEAVGVPDIVATALAVAVLGLLGIDREVRPAVGSAVPREQTGRLYVLGLAAVVMLVVPAVLARHEHHGDEPGQEHDVIRQQHAEDHGGR